MRAIILYPLFVVCGAVLAALIGLFVERELSNKPMSVLVFIALFFASFYVAWKITSFIVERTIRRTVSGRPVG